MNQCHKKWSQRWFKCIRLNFSRLQIYYNAMKKCSHRLRLVEFKDEGERIQMKMTFIEGINRNKNNRNQEDGQD